MKVNKVNSNKNSFASKASGRAPSKPSKNDLENLQKLIDFERDLDDKSKNISGREAEVSAQSFDHSKPGQVTGSNSQNVQEELTLLGFEDRATGLMPEEDEVNVDVNL